jgi:Helix-turn-helix
MDKRDQSDLALDAELLSQWLRGLGDNSEVVAAGLLGVHPATVARWRTGESIPRRRKIEKLAELIGVSEDRLLSKRAA